MFTNASLEECKRIDEFCHAQQPPIAFIRAETRGVFASIFTDFGPDFTVIDVDGKSQGHASCNLGRMGLRVPFGRNI